MQYLLQPTLSTMLAVLLRPPSRRAWRLGRPLLATLDGVNALKALSVPSVRCFSSSVEEGESVESSVKEGLKSGRKKMTWEVKLLTLKTFKEMYGNLLIRTSFVVPTGDIRWPRDAWGYRLGQGASVLRRQAAEQKLSPQLEAQLREIGFVYNVSQFQWDEIIMPALRHYHKVHGNTDVPQNFSVPSDDDAWPRQAWTWNLGRTVALIRCKKAYSRQVRESEEELRELKFCYKISIIERDWNEKILPALKIFRQEFDHCIVERPFKVPSEQPWPSEMWKIHLGKVVSSIRAGTSYLEQATRDKDILVQLGFTWDYYGSNWRDRVLPALEMCAAEYGHFRHPFTFVIPHHDPWPKNVWGMGLGMQLYMMRYIGSYFPYIGCDAERLEALGFSFELRREAWQKRVELLLETYETIFGDREVPDDFVIPSESPWPEKVWGVHLGIFVARNSQFLTK